MPKCLVLRHEPNQPAPTRSSQDRVGQGDQLPSTSSNTADRQRFADSNQPKSSSSKTGEKQTPPRDQNRPGTQINDLYNTEKDAEDAAKSFADAFSRRGDRFSCKSNDLIPCSPCTAWFKISREGGKYRLIGDLHNTCIVHSPIGDDPKQPPSSAGKSGQVHSPIGDDPKQPPSSAGKSGQEKQRPTTSSNSTDQETFSDWNQPKSSASKNGKNQTSKTSDNNSFAGGFTGGLAGEAQAESQQFSKSKGTKQNAEKQSRGPKRDASLINDLYSTKQDVEDAADFISDTFQRKGDRFTCKINEFIPNKCPAWFRIGKEGKDWRLKGNIRHTCNVDNPIRNDSESSENDQSEFFEEPEIQPNQKKTDHDSDIRRDESNHLGGEAQAAFEQFCQGTQQNSARQSEIFDDEEAALLQSFKDLNGNPTEPPVNKSGENHEETITFVEGDPAKTCLICQEVFTTPFLLKRHKGGKKLCPNKPCHDQRHPVNDHFMIPFLTEEEADDCLSRFCKRTAMHKLTCKKEYACRMSRVKGINCTSKLKVKTGHRMGSDGKVHKVYIATGCNFHLHGPEIPIYGLDIIQNFLSQLVMKAHLLDIFIFSYNYNIVRPTKTIKDF